MLGHALVIHYICASDAESPTRMLILTGRDRVQFITVSTLSEPEPMPFFGAVWPYHRLLCFPCSVETGVSVALLQTIVAR